MELFVKYIHYGAELNGERVSQEQNTYAGLSNHKEVHPQLEPNTCFIHVLHCYQ